jgi:hypothetical protein
MTDEQNSAEALDGNVVGDDPTHDVLPDLHQDGDIGPMSSEDPTVLSGGTEARDDEATREWREQPEAGGGDPARNSTDKQHGFSLLSEDESGPDQLDVEEELLGEKSSPDDGYVGPEDAAMHVEPGV